MPRPSEIDPDAPPGLDEWFAQAAAREPAARFQSALELARALLAVCDPEEAGALAEGRLTGQYPVLKPPAVSKSTDAASPRAEAASGERQAQRPPAPAPAPDAAQAKSPRRSSRPAKRRSERPASERSRDRRVLQIVPSVAPPKKRPKLQIIPSAPPGEIVMRERAPAAGGFFVMVGPKTSGPVSLEQLKTGVASGTTPASALVWTHGWPAWRSALEVLATSEPEPGGGAQSRPAQDDITHLAGKADLPHDAPPAVPKRRRGAETLPAPGSAVRQVGAGGPPLREPTYFLVDGAVSVGPVRASVLRRGIEQGRVPWSTMVWRAGLDRWVSPAEVLPEILAWDAAPPGELWGRPGLEAVGQRSLVPPAAPPTMAPRTRGRTK
jgi:serine/threonine-protein kinase